MIEPLVCMSLFRLFWVIVSNVRITNPVRYHCKSAIDCLQSWASFAWMHDNAIHDSPFDVWSESLSPINRLRHYRSSTELGKCLIPAHALTSGTLTITESLLSDLKNYQITRTQGLRVHRFVTVDLYPSTVSRHDQIRRQVRIDL